MSDPIRLQHVTCRLGRSFAVRDLSMRVQPGSVYGLLGPNGSGKTTTIRLIMGMLAPDDGQVTILGHDIPDGAPHALARIGCVPERLHLYAGLSIDEAMRYHAAFFPSWDAQVGRTLLGEFGLRHGQVIGSMSKGESGKLMMLLALAQRPDLLVLDEPTDGLDPVARRDVISAVMAYVADTKATVLITSHLVHEIERMCDWVALLDDGTMVIEEPMAGFRDVLRRLRVAGAPPTLGALPFSVVARRMGGSRAEEWVVRGFGDPGRQWLESNRMELLDVQHLDLEETVVELLRSSRVPSTTGGSL
jgi:ABC-2 type transport system ATP-binding protein